MLGDLEKAALAESSMHKSLTPRALVNLNNIPLKEGDIPYDNFGDLKYTNFDYYIKYRPRPEKQYQGRPFFIVADILPSQKLRFHNWESLLNLAKKNKHLQWILDNTNLCKETIDLAAQNLNLPIRLNFDQLKHSNMLKQQIFEQTGEMPMYSMYREPNEAKADRMRYETWLETHKKGSGEQV